MKKYLLLLAASSLCLLLAQPVVKTTTKTTVSWIKSPSVDVVKYKVVRQLSGGPAVTNETTGTAIVYTNLLAGNYTFTVSAINSSDWESIPVSATHIVPSAPQPVSAVSARTTVEFEISQ